MYQRRPDMIKIMLKKDLVTWDSRGLLGGTILLSYYGTVGNLGMFRELLRASERDC